MRLYGEFWPTYTVGYGKSFKDDELAFAADTARIYSAKNVAVKLRGEPLKLRYPK
jgi:asparagine synthase (glutamine-hydrolysing)